MKLNEEQTLAVEHPVGSPAVLIAGAGSGKTRVLTERVRWLMAHGVPPRRICAITFTNKAAGELKERLGLGAGTPPDREPRVSTIHSLALGGIRKDPRAFGLQHTVTPLDDYDQAQLLKKIIEHKAAKDGREEAPNAWAVLEKIGFHRARGVGFRREYTDAVHKRALAEHAGYHALSDEQLELWELFEDEKRRSSVVDFDDMLHLAVRRLRSDPDWRARVQRQFDHVLMDEAQDTNPVQWEFVNGLLGPGNPNLYVVGDISQSIYSFSGATPGLLKAYSEGWRGTVPAMYRIARNHRSARGIVRLANRIQKSMINTVPLQMQEWREEEGAIKRLAACLPQDVAFAVAAEIQRDAQRKRDPVLYRENAILVRSAVQIRDVEGELVRRRIPYVVRGGRGLLQTEEVRDMLAYLRLASNRKDFTAFVRCASVPRCGVGEVALRKLRAEAVAAHDGDLMAAAASNPRLQALAGTVEQISMFKGSPVAVLDKLLALFDYRKYVEAKYKRDHDKQKVKLDNIDRFVLMVASLAEDGLTLEDLIFKLTLDKPRGDDTERAVLDRDLAAGELTREQYDRRLAELEHGSVVVSTIHSAKGLEWRRVYVTNVVEGSLPHKFAMGSEGEVEEERRLFYVACTRARDSLVLCVPEKAQVQANVSRLAPSRFLVEIGAAQAPGE